MKTNSGKRVMSIFAHIVLILLSFMCLFFFAILLINATHSHAELQKGFSIIPGKHFLDNLRSVANDGSFPMFRGIINSVIVSGCSAALCTYFSSLTAYGIYAYDFKGKKVAFTLCFFNASKIAGVFPFSYPASKVRYRIFESVF